MLCTLCWSLFSFSIIILFYFLHFSFGRSCMLLIKTVKHLHSFKIIFIERAHPYCRYLILLDFTLWTFLANNLFCVYNYWLLLKWHWTIHCGHRTGCENFKINSGVIKKILHFKVNVFIHLVDLSVVRHFCKTVMKYVSFSNYFSLECRSIENVLLSKKIPFNTTSAG